MQTTPDRSGVTPLLALILSSLSLSPAMAEKANLLFQAPFTAQAGKDQEGKAVPPLQASRVSHSADAPAPLAGKGPGEAVSLPVAGQLVYEGAGHAYIPSGSLSFWWRADEKPQKAAAEVFHISSLQRFYFSRFIRLWTSNGRLSVTLYSGDSAEAREDEGALQSSSAETIKKTRKKPISFTITSPGAIPQGRWTHVSVSWDMAKGLSLYLDGKLVGLRKNPWFFGGNINHIALASGSSSYTKSGTATFAQSFADVRVYDSWLGRADVARLAEGQDISPENEIGPLLAHRSQRLGLHSETVPTISLSPHTGAKSPSGSTLWLKQIGTPRAYDVKRKTHAGIDGDLGRAWPMYQGYSDSGRKLRVELSPDASFNVLQALATGAMEIPAPASAPTSASASTADEPPPLLRFNTSAVEVASARLEKSVAATRLDVVRHDGLLFNLSLYQAEERPFPQEGAEGWSFMPLSRPGADESPATLAPLIAQEFPPYDQRILTATGTPEEGAAEALSHPAHRLLHLIGPETATETGLRAIALDLMVEGPLPATGLQLSVIDPVGYERRTAVVNIRVSESPDNGGKKRLRAVLDLRDLVLAKGNRPWLILHASETLRLVPQQSRIGYQWSSVAEATPEFFEDQYALVNDAFQERSEGRPWAHDPAKIKLLGGLLDRIDTLRRLDPANQLVQGYWHWTHPGEAPPAIELPPVPTTPQGLPGWAFHTEAAITLFQKAAYWWIDERQNDVGEFGAPDGINDDTDLIQDWLAIDFMRGPDEKIRRSIEKVADISWHRCTVDGISKQLTDTLHIYEWGINAQTLAFVLNYGDPVYFERLLRFASHYPELMTETCPEHGGHLHFKSWYFGVGKIVTEGIYGRDILKNALHLQPAMLIGWYNGDSRQQEIVARWTSAMMDHISEHAKTTDRIPGLSVAIPSGRNLPQATFELAFSDAVWASWNLSGQEKFKTFAGAMIDYELNRRPLRDIHTTSSILGAYLQETGDTRWDERWLEMAGDATLWERSIHNSNYKELNAFFAAWLRTQDDSWLDKGAALARYHTEWSYPMLTEAEATTDRVWLPQRLANMTTLGGLSILRNQIFPKHAVSWQHATGRFTPLVRVNSPQRLELELWNLEENPVQVDARVWRLDAGLYEITAHPAAAEGDEPLWQREAELARYSRVPLEIPASGGLKVSFRLKEKRPAITSRADLAISHLDAVYQRESGELVATIHNIGTRPSPPFRVTARQGKKILKTEEFGPLGPPEEYRTRKQQLHIPAPDPQQPITIHIETATADSEITLDNNSVTLTPEALAAP